MPSGRKISQFPAAAGINNADVVGGVQNGVSTKFSFATIFLWLKSVLIPSDIGAVPTTRTVNGKSLTNDISLNATDVGARDASWMPTATDVGARPDTWTPSAADVGAIPATEKGVANGVASLDGNGQVPSSQLDLSGKQSTITASGILKGDGAGGVSAATAGTDYQAPLTAGTDYTTPAQLADKANQAQLAAYVETGTTASRNYAVGEYFCWNGSLLQATSAISAGTSINSGSGGNCKAAYATAYSSGAWTPTNGSAVSNAPERNGFIRYGNILVVYVAITLNSDLANLSQVDICTDVASEMGVGSVLTVFANAPAFSTFTSPMQSDILLRLQYNNNKLTLINRSGSVASKTNRVVYANIVLSVL